MRARLAALAFAFVVALGSGLRAAPAAGEPVDLVLVLSVDSSGSINPREFALQREGYARALTHPKVLRAIADGPHRAIAVTMVEWSGPAISNIALPWRRLAGAADAEAVAAVLRTSPRSIFGGGTAVGAAILNATGLFEGSGFEGTRKVIDVSGDGANNRGIPPEGPRDLAVARGITINGLPILGEEAGLDRYYRDSVIGGPGAFVVVARDFDDFERAVLDKLIQELRVSQAR
jgi:hypothetical protein